MAPQPQGPRALGHLTTTGTQDAGLILSQIQMMKVLEVPFYCSSFCEHCHAGVSTWLKKFFATTNMPTANNPVRIHCKTGSTSARFVFNTRTKCQEFVATYRNDGVPCAVENPFCNTSATIMVRQSKSPEDRETGKRVAPLWNVLATKLREVFFVTTPKAITSSRR